MAFTIILECFDNCLSVEVTNMNISISEEVDEMLIVQQYLFDTTDVPSHLSGHSKS